MSTGVTIAAGIVGTDTNANFDSATAKDAPAKSAALKFRLSDAKHWVRGQP
jgi:hypothetical protein